jgi:putative tricarboxylic transport membrane protein
MRSLRFCLLAALLVARAACADVSVATSGTFTAAYLALKPELERIANDTVTTAATSIGAGADTIPARLARGETIDIVIASDEVLKQLIADGLVAADSRVELARSTIGIAVRAGAPRPDIGTVDALRDALLRAQSLAYSGSVSGTYVSTQLFQRLGIAEQVAAKSRKIDRERVGAVVARGDAEIGFQQLSELLPIEGIDVVGPLPDEVQYASVFSAGVVARSAHDAAARAMIRFLASPEAAAAIERTGIEPLVLAARAQAPSAGTAAGPSFDQLRIDAPAAPGGGWDQTARAMQQALERARIVRTPVVDNVPGAAGTIGLARFIGAERGDGDAVLVSGLIMLGGIVTHRSPVTLADVTPIARLTGEYEVLTVPTSSPFRTLDDFVRAFKERPESISWGGGSAGGSDQILAGLIAQAVGVDPRRVNYIAFSGGGESLSAILGGQVSVGVNGLAEFAPQIEAGTVRVLAISSAERLPGVDAPTLREQGVDVEFENWRSIVAAPGLSEEQRAKLEGAIAALVRSPEWRELLDRYRWLDRYLPGDEFARFAAAEEERVRDILAKLGTGDAAATSLLDAGPYPLVVLGGLVLFGALAALSGRARGARAARVAATPEAGAPDAAAPLAAARHKWRALALIGIAAVVDLLLVERAGFLIASAILFWLVARAFDERHPLRDAACALAVATAAYFLFANVLELPLPAGVLAGWL